MLRESCSSATNRYPTYSGDTRLPHLAEKITSQIHKTALGAESTVPFHFELAPPLDELKKQGYRLVALEQDSRSIPLHQYKVPQKIALLLGEEVDGINADLLAKCDDIVEIPMQGKKESFNVSVAAALALYQFSVVSYNTP